MSKGLLAVSCALMLLEIACKGDLPGVLMPELPHAGAHCISCCTAPVLTSTGISLWASAWQQHKACSTCTSIKPCTGTSNQVSPPTSASSQTCCELQKSRGYTSSGRTMVLCVVKSFTSRSSVGDGSACNVGPSGVTRQNSWRLQSRPAACSLYLHAGNF